MGNKHDADQPPPPRTYIRFTERYPELEQAWSKIHEAGREGPLDGETTRLIKLALAMGAGLEGQVHSGVRKALAQGISKEAIEQVVALAAGSVGLPTTAALYTWVHDVIENPKGPRKGCC